jgi:hypothetical protein
MNTTLTVLGILAALVILVWLGLRIPPAPFAAFAGQAQELAAVPLPAGLPGPVERFYRQLYGESVPVITSAVLSGRGTLRLPSRGGIRFPVRFRITHAAGQGYRHYFEATFFGWPIMRVNEHYLEGRARLALPFGVTEGEPKVDQGAALALWAESVAWLPALLVTDPAVRWQAVDAETALLAVPAGAETERFLVRFDPASSQIWLLESMRYKGAADPAKTLWLNQLMAWQPVAGQPVAATAALTWLDEGSPWAVFTVENVVYNADVQETLRATGP